jgi:hypothetical protein
MLILLWKKINKKILEIKEKIVYSMVVFVNMRRLHMLIEFFKRSAYIITE